MSAVPFIPDQSFVGTPNDQVGFCELNTVIADIGSGRTHASVTCMHFDEHEELLWMGNSVGHVTSYYSFNLEKYSSFQVTLTNDIRDILALQNCVLILTNNYLRCSQKGGLSIFHLRDPEMIDMQVMLLTLRETLMIAGHQKTILEVDIASNRIINRVMVENGNIVRIKQSDSLIFLGHSEGYVSSLDINRMQPVFKVENHTGALCDLSLQDSTLITTGFSNNQGTLIADSFLGMYDIRKQRKMPPCNLMFDASFACFCTDYRNRATVLSSTGQMQIIDITGLTIPPSMVIHQLNLAEDTFVVCYDLSSSSRALAVGDSAGIIHLWSDSTQPIFNEYSQSTEFAPPLGCDFHISYDDVMTPYSIIKMPHTDEVLASEWPPELTVEKHWPPVSIPPEFLENIVYQDFIGYGPNPGTRLRNQMLYDLKDNSFQEGTTCNSPEGQSALDSSTENDIVPELYRKVELNSFDVEEEDLELEKYNNTGLQSVFHRSLNSYCNSLLQVLYYITPLQKILRSHLCKRDFCMACELGFLFYIIEHSPNTEICLTSNFLRAFKAIPEATALGLVLNEHDEFLPNTASLARLIQNFNRFILQQVFQMCEDVLRNDEKGQSHHSSYSAKGDSTDCFKNGSALLTNLIGATIIQKSICKCGNSIRRELTSFTHPLTYPELLSNDKPVRYAFGEIVSQSVNASQVTQAWCSKCQRYQPTTQIRQMTRLPKVLFINCQLDHEADVTFWKAQQKLTIGGEGLAATQNVQPVVKMCRYGSSCSRSYCKFKHDRSPDSQFSEMLKDVTNEPWVPMKLVADLKDGDEYVFKNADDNETLTDSAVLFELTAAVLHVCSDSTRGHLVSHVKVPTKSSPDDERWYLFNDIAISLLEEKDSNAFNLSWCRPSVLCFSQVGYKKDYEHLKVVDKAAAVDDFKSNFEIHFPSLVPSVEATPDYISKTVGIDCKFVFVSPEESEIRADGTHRSIKSAEQSVTHITCIPSKNDVNDYVAFIDDAIIPSEQMFDYGSKIKANELSGKSQTNLKASYIKLRHLVNCGITFVGYQLKKQFKIINIHVPKEQIIDVGELYKLSRQQMAPLSYLSWYFLHKVISSYSSPNQNCFENASTALKLYAKYLEITNEGRTLQMFRTLLQQMYTKGKESNWKITP